MRVHPPALSQRLHRQPDGEHQKQRQCQTAQQLSQSWSNGDGGNHVRTHKDEKENEGQ